MNKITYFEELVKRMKDADQDFSQLIIFLEDRSRIEFLFKKVLSDTRFCNDRSDIEKVVVCDNIMIYVKIPQRHLYIEWQNGDVSYSSRLGRDYDDIEDNLKLLKV